MRLQFCKTPLQFKVHTEKLESGVDSEETWKITLTEHNFRQCYKIEVASGL